MSFSDVFPSVKSFNLVVSVSDSINELVERDVYEYSGLRIPQFVACKGECSGCKFDLYDMISEALEGDLNNVSVYRLCGAEEIVGTSSRSCMGNIRVTGKITCNG